MATTQTKESGTQAPTMQAVQYDTLQVYTFRNDVIGLLGYQGTPVLIDSITRDALFNGVMADIENQTSGQGMQANYVKISWNETSQINGYYITDLQIGIVATVTRDFNTGPAYLIDALKTVPWLGTVIAKLGMGTSNSWKAWKHLNQKRLEPYNHWVDELKSNVIRVSSNISEEALPQLPDTATVKATIKSQGSFQSALGECITQLLDKGYAVTFPSTDAYDIDICYEKGNVFVTHSGGPVGGYDTWNYDYYVHVRFWWEFTTDPEITTATLNGRTLFALTATIIYTIIVLVGALAIVGIGAYNLTHTRSEYQKWAYVWDPNTSTWVWRVVESGSKEGPPDWWSYVVPIIALIGVGAAVYFLLPLRPKRK